MGAWATICEIRQDGSRQIWDRCDGGRGAEQWQRSDIYTDDD